MNLWNFGEWRFAISEDEDGNILEKRPVLPKFITPDRFLYFYPSVPILLGDQALTQDTMTAIEAYTSSLPTPPDVSKEEMRDLVHGPGLLLLQLVILRTYLHRQPRDDDHIWHLWRQDRIVRTWTPFEVTLAASRGQSQMELESDGRIRYLTTKGERGVTYVDGSLPTGTHLVHIVTNGTSPHIWPNGVTAGLIGEPLVFEVRVAGPPPKPRSLKKKPVVQFENAEGSKFGDDPRVLSQEPVPEGQSGLRRSRRNRG